MITMVDKVDTILGENDHATIIISDDSDGQFDYTALQAGAEMLNMTIGQYIYFKLYGNDKEDLMDILKIPQEKGKFDLSEIHAAMATDDGKPWVFYQVKDKDYPEAYITMDDKDGSKKWIFAPAIGLYTCFTSDDLKAFAKTVMYLNEHYPDGF